MRQHRSIKANLIILLVSIVISSIVITIYRFITKDIFLSGSYILDIIIFSVILFISTWVGIFISKSDKK